MCLQSLVTTILKSGTISGTATVSAIIDNQIVNTNVILPFKIISIVPNNNYPNYSLTGPITIKFSQAIIAGTNYSQIYVKNITNGKYMTITKTISRNTLIINMTSSRLHQETYQVYIPAGAIKDKSRNNLTTTYLFKFKN